MLPPHEGPEPGYLLVLAVYCHALFSAATVSGSISAPWPQLKPSYGNSRDTTTTVGAHRGASSGAGWSFHPDGTFFINSGTRRRHYPPRSSLPP